MNVFPGEIRQLGYVVRQLDTALAHWSRVLGVGPWFVNERVPIRHYRYRGQAHDPHHAVALANAGALQIELIEVRQPRVPSMYLDFLAAGQSGLQHVAYWTRDFDADLARLTGMGHRVVMQGEVGEQGRFVYFDTELHPGTVVELSEVLGPKGRLFEHIRQAAQDWDGQAPARPFPAWDELPEG